MELVCRELNKQMQSSSPSLFTLVDLTFGAARPSISKLYLAPKVIIFIYEIYWQKSETNAIRAEMEVAPPNKAVTLLWALWASEQKSGVGDWTGV